MRAKFNQDFSFSATNDMVTKALEAIKDALFIDKLHNVGHLYVCPTHQELENLTFMIPIIISPLYCEKEEKENSDPDGFKHLQHLTFKESEGSQEIV